MGGGGWGGVSRSQTQYISDNDYEHFDPPTAGENIYRVG